MTSFCVEPVVTLKPKVRVSKGKASAKQLSELHRLFSQALYEYMTNTPAGNHKPAMLNVVRAFLNDNGVEHSSSVEALELLSKGLVEENTLANTDSFTVPF